MAVHPDGTIFAILGDPYSDDSHPMGQAWVIGVNGSSGAPKFSVPLPDDTAVFSHEPFIMIAGDGYAYVPYVTYSPDKRTLRLKLLRVSSAGASDNIDIKTFTPESENAQLEVGYSSVITNADTGVLLTWGAWNTYSWEPRQPPVPPNTQTYGIAVTTGTGVSVLDAPLVGQVNPALQAQDGSFVGSYGLDMVSFDQSGNVRWIVPNYSPLMATADGGVIATTDYVSATVFDQDGNATGQMANMPTQSWTGTAYLQPGAVQQVVAAPLSVDGASFWPEAGANPSGNGTAIVQCPCLLQSTSGPAPRDSSAGPVSAKELGGSVHQKVAANGPVTPQSPPAYVILVGDPGLNTVDCPRDSQHCHDVGDSFNVAAQTEANRLSGLGNSAAYPPQRVSSIQDFNQGLTQNGYIDGGVIFFGHGGVVSIAGQPHWAIMPGEQAGPDTNISEVNVQTLSPSNARTARDGHPECLQRRGWRPKLDCPPDCQPTAGNSLRSSSWHVFQYEPEYESA